MRSQTATAIALAALSAACGSPVPTPSPIPTVSPTPTPTIRPPCASVDPAFGCTDPPSARPIGGQSLPGPGTELDAGTYTMEGFAPNVYFTVGAGWTTVQQFQGFFDIQDDPGSLDVVAVQWTLATGMRSAEDAATDIEARDNLTVSDRQAVTIDRLTGIKLVVGTTDPADSQPVIFRPVLTTPPGPISIGSGRRLAINLFSTDVGVLAILVGGSIAQWDRAVQLSQPVLDSIVIGD